VTRFDTWLQHFDYDDSWFDAICNVQKYNFSKSILEEHIKKAGLYQLIAPTLRIEMKRGHYLHNQHILYVALFIEEKLMYDVEFESEELRVAFNKPKRFA
jgi:hypothetical protein